MPRVIGDVAVVISPDTRYFRAKTEAEIRRSLAGISANVRIGGDARGALAAVEGFKARVKALSDTAANLRLDPKISKAGEAQVAAFQAQILKLSEKMRSLTMAADTKKLDAQILAKQAELRKLQASMSSFQMDANSTKIALKIATLEHQARKLEEQLHDMPADADVSLIEAKFNAVHSELALLKRDASKTDLAMSNVAALRNIAVVKADLTALQEQARDLRLGANISPADLLALDSGLLRLESGFEKLSAATRKASKDSNAFQGIISGTRWWNIAVLGTGAWHFVLDGLLETLIAVTGAAIALTAGILAMADSAKDVATQMESVLKVSSALHQNVTPLTGSFHELAKAMAPRTVEAFGGGLNLMATQSGNLLHEMEPVVNLLDDWVAKIDLWVGSQHQFGKAVSGGSVYLKQFGQIFGTLGMAISNLLSKDPGLAKMLGAVIIFGTQLVNIFSQLPGPLVKTALALHGIWLWGKLLVAVPVLAFAKSLGILNREQVKAIGDATHFRDVLKFFLLNPYGWAIDAAVALGYVAYQSTQADDATKKFIGDLEQGLSYLSGGQAILQISADIGQLNDRIAHTDTASVMKHWNDLGHTFQSVGDDAQAFGSDIYAIFKDFSLAPSGFLKSLKDAGRAIKDLFVPGGGAGHQVQSNIRDMRGEIVKLTDEQTRLFHVTGLLVTGHYKLSLGAMSVVQAWALMSLAGVKANDSFVLAWQKVQNLIAGYRGLSVQGGILRNSVNALSFASLQQQSKVEDLNNAWDAFFKTITGGASGFLSFAEQTIGLYRSMSDSGVKLTSSNGKVHTSLQLLAKSADAGAVSMNGLNTASLNARQTFLQSADAANTQVDNLTLLASAAGLGATGTNLLAQATKDMVQSLLPAAHGSQELTSVLYALAQRGGYQGANSFKALSEWAGKTKNPLASLDKITTTLTTDAANLTQDVKNLSVALGQTLNDAIAAALLQAGGGQKVFNDFANALHKGFTNSQAQKDAALALGNQLLLLTHSTKDAHDEFITFAQQMGIGRKQAEQLWSEIAGRLTPSLQAQADKTLPDVTKMFQTFAEVGLSMTQKQADSLWTQITTKLGPKLDALGNLASGPAKNKFIDWAEHGLHMSQQKAYALWNELVTLQGKINNLHGKTIKIVAEADGFVTITSTVDNAKYKISQGAWFSPHAAGGRIPGFAPGVDNYPAMLSGGEYVFTPEAASAIGYDTLDQINQAHSRKRLGGYVPGFASGGLAGPPDAWPDQMASSIQGRAQADTSKALAAALVPAVHAAVKLAQAALGGSGQAVLAYAESFRNKVPYVWGGSTPAGWDCSGFVSYVYDHFKLFNGRTDAAGLQRWAKPSSPTPGGLAFYGSPAHHVGFVVDGHTLLSALGRKWGTIESSLQMGDNSGYGVPPQGFGGKGGAGGGGGPGPGAGKLKELAFTLLAQYGWANQWPAFDLLETREAGWRMNAVNPNSGAAGLAQFIHGWSEYFQYGGNPGTALGQLTAMMNYIAQRYPSGPDQAWAHEVSQGWYSRGGPAGMAGGGSVGAYRAKLAAQETAERRDYAAVAADMHAKGVSTGTRSELGTLAKRQAAELAAYRALAGSGLTSSRVSHLGAEVRAESRTAANKGLAHVRGIGALRNILGALNVTATHPPSGLGGGSGPALTHALRTKLTLGEGEVQKAYAKVAADIHRKGLSITTRRELGTLAKRESAEVGAWNTAYHHFSRPNVDHLGTEVRAELGTAQDKGLAKVPGIDNLVYRLRLLDAYIRGASTAGITAPGSFPVTTTQRDFSKDPDRAALLAAVRREIPAFWNLAGAKLPAKGPTAGQRKAWAAWDQVLEKQQERTFGLTPGTKGGGAFQQLLDAYTVPGRSPAWAIFSRDLNYMISEVSGSGIRGGINPPGTPPNSGYVPYHYFHTKWGYLLSDLRQIVPLLKVAQASASWDPRNLGRSHTVLGGVEKFDTGAGVLKPGLNLTWNGTGRDEPLRAAGAGYGNGIQSVRVELDITGGDQELVQLLRRIVRVRGGGSVQAALGRN